MKRMYSINDLGAELKLPCHEAPGPRGMSLEYDWTPEAAESLVNKFKTEETEAVVLDGHPQAWLACYLAIAMEPVPVGLFIPPMGGDVPMKRLSFGAFAPEGHVTLETEAFNDGILLQFAPDTRDYQADYLGKITLPPELKGQHVYLQGMAPNFITGSLALTLAGEAESVSVAGMDGNFLCVYSADGSRKLGQMTASRPMMPPKP